MRIGEYRVRVRIIPTLVLLAPIPLFLYLAGWQWERADQKREFAALVEERGGLPALDISGPIADPRALRYRQVRVRGELEPRDQILIENRRRGGRTGFHVITPLRIDGSELRVLVNRGWIAAEADGSAPRIETPVGTLDVSGEAEIPAPPALALDKGAATAREWGGRWPYLTLELFSGVVPYPVSPILVLQAPDGPAGFIREWPREPPKEYMHIGYAIQWLAFALIALGIWLRLSLVKTKE